MNTRTLGPFQVSAIGLGCMNMSMGYGAADPEESERLLPAALDAGYTFLDTAAIYGSGHNEQLIGRVLSKRRDEFVLASKCGIHRSDTGSTAFDARPETIRKTCEQSLRNLQTEVIDLYYLHRIDPEVPVEESVGALGELVSAGKVQTIGLSEISAESLLRAHKEYPITAVQSEYSLWTRTPERRMLETCKMLGITFVPFSPLGRSFFTGKGCDVTTLGETDLRATIARPRFEPAAFQANSKLLQPYAEMAQAAGCSMAQLALAWLLAQQDRTLIPIPGTKHIAYMQENAGAADVTLSADIVAALDELINENTVEGTRYTAKLMTATDSERD